MGDNKQYFREILKSDRVTKFKTTPIQLIFSTRGIPGVDRYAENVLRQKGYKNPRDLLKVFRKFKEASYDFKRKSFNIPKALDKFDAHLLSIGFVSPKRKIVCIAIYAIDPYAPRDLVNHWLPK